MTISRGEPWRSGEQALSQATLRIVRPGVGFGTAVLVTPGGRALTCHHVMRKPGKYRAIDQSGAEWDVTWVSAADELLAQLDVAVIQLSSPDRQQRLPPAAPMSLVPPGAKFRTQVMLPSTYIPKGVPFTGTLEGRTEEVTYETSDSLFYGPSPLHVVRNLTVERGMSGAPVWDEAQEGVAGLIASGIEANNIGGFVVPLSAVAASPFIADAYAENDRSVARFGTAPNRLAVAWVGGRVSSVTVERLIARGIYSPEKAIAREQFKPALERFLASSKRAFPIVGPAGCGKSSLLSLLAETHRASPVLFVRSADARSDDSPAKVLDRAIASAVANSGTRFASFECIRPPDEAGSAALLLWDAVNELPSSDLFIVEEWLPELIDAVRKAGMKLVFSCRPELFNDVEKAAYRHDLFPGPARAATETEPSTDGWFTLGGFSDDELRLARQAYHVPAALPEVITRHPLLLRLAAEAVEKSGSFVTRSGVLKSSLDRSVARVAKLAKSPHRAIVDQTVQKLAGEVRRSPNGVAPPEIALPADQAAIMRNLVIENVIEEVADGFRFVFDEIYEIALASAIDVIGVAESEEHQDPKLGAYIEPSVLSLALELLIDKGEIDRFRTAGDRLVARMQSNGSTERQVYRAAKPILDLVRTPETDILKEKAVHAAIDARPGLAGPLVRTQTRALTTLPWQAFRTLLYDAVLDERDYGWREKDVRSKEHRPGLTILRQTYGVGKVIAEVMEEAPEAGAALLIEWVSDETKLKHGDQRQASSSEATVGSFAICMLWIYRERVGAERIFRDVILVQKPHSLALVEAFADESPRVVLNFLVTTPLEIQEKEFWFFRGIWVLLGGRADATIRREMSGPAWKFYEHMFDKLTGGDLNQALADVAWFGFGDDSTLQGVLGRLVHTRELQIWSLIELFKAGRINLPTAVQSSTQVDQYPEFVAQLVNAFRSLRPKLSLRTLWGMILGIGISELLDTPNGDSRFMNMLYEVGYAEALENGITTEIRRLLDDAPEQIGDGLVYLAFDDTHDAEQAKFRSWLALEVCRSELAMIERELVLRYLLNARELFDSHRRVVLKIVKAADARNLFAAVMATHGAADIDLLDTYFAVIREAQANDPAQLSLLDAFEANRRKFGQDADGLYDAAFEAADG